MKQLVPVKYCKTEQLNDFDADADTDLDLEFVTDTVEHAETDRVFVLTVDADTLFDAEREREEVAVPLVVAAIDKDTFGELVVLIDEVNESEPDGDTVLVVLIDMETVKVGVHVCDRVSINDRVGEIEEEPQAEGDNCDVLVVVDVRVEVIVELIDLDVLVDFVEVGETGPE